MFGFADCRGSAALRYRQCCRYDAEQDYQVDVTENSQNIGVLRQYIPHAWSLADKHTQQLAGFKESPVRLVDMALWVKRS